MERAGGSTGDPGLEERSSGVVFKAGRLVISTALPRRTFILFLIAIWTTPFESTVAPPPDRGIRPVALPPAGIDCGRTWPSAAGDSGVRPKEFLLYWMANPESGVLDMFSIVNCWKTRPACDTNWDLTCIPSPRSDGSTIFAPRDAASGGSDGPVTKKPSPPPPATLPMCVAGAGPGSSSMRPPRRSMIAGGGGAGAAP